MKFVEYPRKAASFAAKREMYPRPITVTDAPPSADGSNVAQRLLLEVEVHVDVRCESIRSDEDAEIGWKAMMDWTSSSQMHATRNKENGELILPANGILKRNIAKRPASPCLDVQVQLCVSAVVFPSKLRREHLFSTYVDLRASRS